MNNYFRPLSLSEGVIYEKENILLRNFSKNDFTEMYVKIDEGDEKNIQHTFTQKPLFIENENENKSVNCIQQLFPINVKIYINNFLLYSLKKLFLFMFHLSLISVFEIIFFFYIASVFENKAIIRIIINFFSHIPTMCSNFNYEQKEIFTDGFNLLVNRTLVNENAFTAVVKRNIFIDLIYVKFILGILYNGKKTL